MNKERVWRHEGKKRGSGERGMKGGKKRRISMKEEERRSLTLPSQKKNKLPRPRSQKPVMWNGCGGEALASQMSEAPRIKAGSGE